MFKSSSSVLFPWICLVAWLLSLDAVHASEFQYFEREIDYWNSAKKAPPAASLPANPTEKKQEDADSFDWKKHLDPKNPEFFKEGDHTPPEPFMEIVRNPSDKNLKNWFEYIDKKNRLTERLQERMVEYLAKEGKHLEADQKRELTAQVRSLPRTSPSVKRYRFRMYFDSTCPHCRRMFETLKTLQDQGYFVEARQIDSGTEGLQNLPIPTTPASRDEIKKFEIQSVPFLLVGDLDSQAVYRMTGFQTPESIFEHLQQAPNVSNRERNLNP